MLSTPSLRPNSTTGTDAPVVQRPSRPASRCILNSAPTITKVSFSYLPVVRQAGILHGTSPWHLRKCLGVLFLSVPLLLAANVNGAPPGPTSLRSPRDQDPAIEQNRQFLSDQQSHFSSPPEPIKHKIKRKQPLFVCSPLPPLAAQPLIQQLRLWPTITAIPRG